MEFGGSTVLGALESLIWARIERFSVETCLIIFCKTDLGRLRQVTQALSCFVEVSIDFRGPRWGLAVEPKSAGESRDAPGTPHLSFRTVLSDPSRSTNGPQHTAGVRGQPSAIVEMERSSDERPTRTSPLTSSPNAPSHGNALRSQLALNSQDLTAPAPKPRSENRCGRKSGWPC